MFVNGDQNSLSRIETDTVFQLQLKSPRNCEEDAKKVKGLMFSGQIFSSFSASEREAIWTRIEHFDGIIPSLFTFWEDFKYFESCAHCIRRLFGAVDRSIWNTMKHMFVDTASESNGLIQTSAYSFRQQVASGSERLDIGYRQLWLYAMRNYDLMPQPTKDDAELLAKPSRREVDERVLYDMAELARRLGFWSEQIRDILAKSPDRHIAHAALLRARNPDHFQYDPIELEALVDRVVGCFSAAKEYIRPSPELLADSEVLPRARCGFPQLKAYTQDAPCLFLDMVHNESTFSSASLTTFFVRRCVYFAFFGKRALPGSTWRNFGPDGSPRATSPLFFDTNVQTTSPTSMNPQNISAGVPKATQQPQEDLYTWQRLEGHTGPIFETGAIGTQSLALEPLYERSEYDEMSEEHSIISTRTGSSSVGQGRMTLMPTDPLDPQGLDSDWPSTPEDSEKEGGLESLVEHNAVREYSPSLYSEREAAGNQNVEEQRQYSEDLERAMRERERLDEE